MLQFHSVLFKSQQVSLAYLCSSRSFKSILKRHSKRNGSAVKMVFSMKKSVPPCLSGLYTLEIVISKNGKEILLHASNMDSHTDTFAFTWPKKKKNKWKKLTTLKYCCRPSHKRNLSVGWLLHLLKSLSSAQSGIQRLYTCMSLRESH